MIEENEVLEITSQANSAFTKGKEMWACLNALSDHYENINMDKISPVSNFLDDRWDGHGGADMNFVWHKWLPDSKHYPLLMVCKVIAHFEMTSQNKKISTVLGNIREFIYLFKAMFESKSILVAEYNQPFQNLSYLTTSDVIHQCQLQFATTATLSATPLTGLNYLASCKLSNFPNAEFLISGSKNSMPWGKTSVTYWARDMRSSLEQENSDGYFFDSNNDEVRSYSPLKMDVVDAIVQSAMLFLDEHLTLINNVFDEIYESEDLNLESYQKGQGRIDVEVRKDIESKYGTQLDHILPLFYISNDEKKAISMMWFYKFEQLIQGAVAWLILLTTGLRNVDMRNLVKGCCQESKRFDLLYYLITNIKKTNLKNYIIPVPPIIKKAVDLATSAKIDRTGHMLLNQKSASSTDNTSTDKKKIGSGTGFNTLIKNFAAHFDIKLETISEDNDNEATAHCVRATLAGYIGSKSHAAIIILKRLFGHSNNLMPDAYLCNNPIIVRDRRKRILCAQKEHASLMAKNLSRATVSGVKGKQLLDGVEHIKQELENELKNESLTEMDFHVRLEERIKEILLMRISGEDIYALHTPVGVICMRSQSDSTDSPCAKRGNHDVRKALNISKDVTDVLATLPNPAHCIGKDCSDALLGKDWSWDILFSFDYYINLLKGQGHENVDIENQAKQVVKIYAPILKGLYAEEREEAYFD
jgi:hypothetical protein